MRGNSPAWSFALSVLTGMPTTPARSPYDTHDPSGMATSAWCTTRHRSLGLGAGCGWTGPGQMVAARLDNAWPRSLICWRPHFRSSATSLVISKWLSAKRERFS